MNIQIQSVSQNDSQWVQNIIRGWGSDFIVSRGRKIYPTKIEGFYAEDEKGNKVGLVTYEVIGDQCEIVTLDVLEKFLGIGTALLNKVKSEVTARGCSRLWLITTNDNIDAILFYQKRGMTIAGIHQNAIEKSRRMKPSIPMIGQYGIPICDEIEFEIYLA